ncbi:MAG: hypothetical protein INF16_07275 [Methylobacterium sp.]|jgi:O-antigen/teichoic acid export membrane protein|nr:hypothetical protein [Methylobacterium sp.]MCE2933396.1 hypothetical protein [Hyphomicrobiales bacterium]MCA3635885.1 hypothetical protein [Methylobacterium sp.]MCA3637341.1 hypothetical protein [Methylobacterium sp.]MCA3645067.1 hypothetical protein [Methylobacterium sp.]
MRNHFKDLLLRGPLSILASSLPGLVNYAIILLLVYSGKTADAGLYRLVLAIFSLAAILTFLDSSKVFVRAVAENDSHGMAELFIGRVYLSGLCFALAGFVAALWFWMGWPSANLTPTTIAIVVFAAFHYGVFDFYAPLLQARQEFLRFFLFAFAKHSVAFLAFVALLAMGTSVLTTTLVQLGVMTAFHALFFAMVVYSRLDFSGVSFGPFSAMRRPGARESMTISVANALPNSLEHIDKLIIGALFGLDALGLYTLGFSTGRFIYNTLKPAIYVFYRRFVEHLPSGRIVLSVGLFFTAFGMVCAALFYLAVQNVPALNRFKGTEVVTVIIFLSYGVAMADAVYSQAFAINRKARSSRLLHAGLWASGACLLIFALATLFPMDIALAMFAAHYFVRHAVTLAILLMRGPESEAA